MPIPQHLKYNPTAKYGLGSVFKYTKDERAKAAAAISSQEMFVSDKESFNVKWFDLTQNYALPYVTTQAIVDAWNANPMQFWQNQLQFAIWCATAGCGVSVKDHILNDTIPPLARAIYIFHVYYQTRRILDRMSCPLPTRESWSAFNNGIDKHVYQAICGEFGIDYNQAAAACHLSDTHAKTNGLGNPAIYASHIGYQVWDVDWNPKTMKFDGKTTNEQVHIEYLTQGDVSNGFVWCMLDKGQGFTKAGIERLNDSIRTYAWSILGSQNLTRTSVLGVGPAFDAQKEAVALVEAVISAKADDLPQSIKEYQDVLQYARSKLDYVLGGGLYMVPSNMNLRINTIQGYNNKIVVATDDMNLGANDGVNTEKVPPQQPLDPGKADPPPTKNPGTPPKKDPPEKQTPPPTGEQDHSSLKTTITIAAIGAGFAYYYIYR